MRSFSIKRRILFGVIVAELFLVAALLVLATFIMQRHALRSFDAALNGRAMSVAALVRFSEGPHPDLEFDATLLPRVPQGDSPDLFEVKTSDGRLLAASPEASKEFTQEKSKASNWDFWFRGVPYRALRLQSLPVLDKEEGDASTNVTLNVTYAASTQELHESLYRAVLTVLVAGALLFAVSLWLSVWAIRDGLRPLSELASSAGSISASNWRLEPTASATQTVEVAPLTRAMSNMLETLHAAFQQQSDFTANAAHELKTPVAILKSTLQSLLQQPRSSDAYRQGVDDALADLGRLEALLHSLLRLSRAEQRAALGAAREVSTVDLVATCESAIVRLAPFARSRTIDVSLAVEPEPILVRADAEDLETIWTNLIENAIRYAPLDSQVKISAARNNGYARVAVRDSGPGVHPEELPHIFDRFHRGDDSRSRESGGYGLGLAITKALVESYGGSITIATSEDPGACFIVELPAAPARASR